jgi:glutaminase
MPATQQASTIEELLKALHGDLASCMDGAVADYIPELAKADPRDFGIVLAMADGRIYAVGDTDKPFTIQSISKPFAYGLALQRLSLEHMQRKVGVEPSGEAFNAISLDPASGIPRNPMINAGAIATSAQIQQFAGPGAEALLLEYFSQLAGRPLDIDQQVYASERDTGHRNRAISHLLRNFDVIEGDVEPGLDLYFRQCSIRVTCRDLGVMAATLACQGRNPLTGERPLDAEATVQMLSLMGTCGMYDFAGQWLHDVGMPAKSGVGGGVLAVVPGQFGIATYSPPLDSFGNSVRGVAACRKLSRSLGLHLYNRNPSDRSAISRAYTGNHCQSRRWRPNSEAVQLRNHGQSLRVLHVQGLLDFYATEKLLANLEPDLATTRVVVLDLQQVQDISPHALGVLARGLARIEQRGIALVISRGLHLPPLQGLAAGEGPTALQQADDLDEAMELAEALLLNAVAPGVDRDAAGQESILQALKPSQRQHLVDRLRPRSFAAGETVIRRGDDGNAMYFVESGRFTTSVSVDLGGEKRRWSRVATFTSGMCFGEVSFLSGRPRIADVVADEAGLCLELRREDFESLRHEDPEAAIELLLVLSDELGGRLARTSGQLAVMEHL